MHADIAVTFTWVDWAIIAIILVSSLISLRRGFVKEALSLLTWVIAGAVAWLFGGALAHHLQDYISTPSARVISACVILFVFRSLCSYNALDKQTFFFIRLLYLTQQHSCLLVLRCLICNRINICKSVIFYIYFSV